MRQPSIGLLPITTIGITKSKGTSMRHHSKTKPVFCLAQHSPKEAFLAMLFFQQIHGSILLSQPITFAVNVQKVSEQLATIGFRKTAHI